MKKQNTDVLLLRLVDYIKDIFLMIGNYLYPSKINSFLEQQILLYPDKQFNKYNGFNKYKRNCMKNELCELIVTDSKVNTLDLPINNPQSFSILFTYLNPDNTIPNAVTQYGYINSFFNGFNDLIKNQSYNDFLEHTTDSIDIFGLGFTLQFMANCFKRLNALSLKVYTRLSSFFHKMYDFNPVTRVIDIDLLLSEYENILLETGILIRIGKSFEKNILVNKPPAPLDIIKEAKKDDQSVPEHLSNILQIFLSNLLEKNQEQKQCLKQGVNLKHGVILKQGVNLKHGVIEKELNSENICNYYNNI